MYELSVTLCRYVLLSENIKIVVPSVPSVSLCHYVLLSDNIKISNRPELSVSSCHYIILSENILSVVHSVPSVFVYFVVLC